MSLLFSGRYLSCYIHQLTAVVVVDVVVVAVVVAVVVDAGHRLSTNS